MNLISKYETVLQDQVDIISKLRETIQKLTLDLSCLENNDYKTKYFTGFPYYSTVKILFDTIQHSIPINSLNVLSKSQMFLLTLMRLRLGLTFKDLAFRFNVSEPVASKAFFTCIGLFYVQLRNLIKMPLKR